MGCRGNSLDAAPQASGDAMTDDPGSVAKGLTAAQREVLRQVSLLPCPRRTASNHRHVSNVLVAHALTRKGLLDRWTQHSNPIHERPYDTHYFALTPFGLAVQALLRKAPQ